MASQRCGQASSPHSPFEPQIATARYDVVAALIRVLSEELSDLPMLAFRAIRADDIVRHRRWMIRAFAIGVAVGTIRIWIAIFTMSGLLAFPAAFRPAFWISFTLHALVAELWLRARPLPTGHDG